MIESKFNQNGDLLCVSTEVENLKNATVTCDCGSVRTYEDGTTCHVVDTGEIYVLYRNQWYKM